jgi:hypothetical protein
MEGAFSVTSLLPSHHVIPVLATNSSLTLDIRESKCFLRGPETLITMKKIYKKDF